MNKEELLNLKEKISKLSKEDKKIRDLYLKRIANGEIYGPMLGLRIEDSYKLSWDDKYSELCKGQGKTIYSDVLFDKDMPEVK